MLVPNNVKQRMQGLRRGVSGLVNPAKAQQSTLAPPAAPQAAPQAAPAPAPPPAPTPQPAPAPAAPPAPTLKGVSVQGIDPNADLRNSTIAPTNDVNRFDLVNERLKNYDATALPEFQAKVRGITQGNAAQGRLGSGMLSTSLGDLNLATENARNSYFGNLLTDATEGTIGDAARNRDELRTERGYQVGQENQAFDRGRQQIFDTDALKGSEFGRAATMAQLGFGNDPSGLIAQLSQMSGQNAANSAAGIGASSANQSYLDLLKQVYAGMGQSGSPNTTPPIVQNTRKGTRPTTVSY